MLHCLFASYQLTKMFIQCSMCRQIYATGLSCIKCSLRIAGQM